MTVTTANGVIEPQIADSDDAEKNISSDSQSDVSPSEAGTQPRGNNDPRGNKQQKNQGQPRRESIPGRQRRHARRRQAVC